MGGPDVFGWVHFGSLKTGDLVGTGVGWGQVVGTGVGWGQVVGGTGIRLDGVTTGISEGVAVNAMGGRVSGPEKGAKG